MKYVMNQLSPFLSSSGEEPSVSGEEPSVSGEDCSSYLVRISASIITRIRVLQEDVSGFLNH